MLSIFVLLPFFSSLLTHFSFALDSISPNQSLSGSQTLVSNGSNFELGFFTPGDSHNYYIGIWYKKVSKQTVVWVANREKPVEKTSTSELKFSSDGNLVLLDQSKTLIWSTSLPKNTSNSNRAVLLDNGNLAILDGLNSSNVLWQSFDHPTDTWLQGAKFGMNKVTKQKVVLTSWKSSDDPSPGPFSVSMDPSGASQFIASWNGSHQYFYTGLWTGHIFSNLSEMIPIKAYTFTHVDNDRENYFTYTVRDENVCGGFVMDVNGQFRQSEWLNYADQWMLFWSQPKEQCDVYSVCGAFGVCHRSKLPFCTCPQGFRAVSEKEWNLNDFSSGCTREIPLQCGSANRNTSSINATNDVFVEIPFVQFPINSVALAVKSSEECEASCLRNCSCTAYSYYDQCLVWNGELLNVQEPNDVETSEGWKIAMAYQQQRRGPTSEDYCAYVTRMTRKTSMCEGPHFPNMFNNKKVQDRKVDEKTTEENIFNDKKVEDHKVDEKTTTEKIFNNKKVQDRKVDEKTTKEKMFTSLGLFGRAEHIGVSYENDLVVDNGIWNAKAV